ncbi:MAG: class I SAM-dependent RNA methyltransferase [Deltaproteobacteria bacterium]|nr:class I SAM-dependent RNA methyltransferase [Deltaproteobacteria bacterium]
MPSNPRRVNNSQPTGVRPQGERRFDLFAMCAPGIEPALYDEMGEIGVEPLRAVHGGVEFLGTSRDLYRANLWLRTAGRVLMRVGEFVAMSFPELARKVRRIPWVDWLAPGTPIEVRAASHGSKLNIRKKIESVVSDTIGERLGEPKPGRAPVLVLARFDQNTCTISLDTSGDLLHRRGHRRETALAPLRETMAAAMLRYAGFDPAEPFVDPMCGAGTLVLEAALWALRRAPGADRDFAFMDFADFDAKLWSSLREEAVANARDMLRAPIVGADANASAAAAAHGNLDRAGLASQVEVRHVPIHRLSPPREPGLVSFNPPFGSRVGSPGSLGTLYSKAGDVLRERFVGWRFGVLTADEAMWKAMRLRYDAAFPMLHGGVRVRLHIGRIATPARMGKL